MSRETTRRGGERGREASGQTDDLGFFFGTARTTTALGGKAGGRSRVEGRGDRSRGTRRALQRTFVFPITFTTSPTYDPGSCRSWISSRSIRTAGEGWRIDAEEGDVSAGMEKIRNLTVPAGATLRRRRRRVHRGRRVASPSRERSRRSSDEDAARGRENAASSREIRRADARSRAGGGARARGSREDAPLWFSSFRCASNRRRFCVLSLTAISYSSIFAL